ncbi:MAG: alpha/beta hydrolase [Rhodospirillaceae bacterium]|jgi:hypothetical protein|nr:alpha/beta hydrolase [Rhodospirillaceae bacterium]MBT5665758.1 alpha/beta hydrolase [Rhodospirillaceae bacterium]MBT5812615.1 alpha/beta hydrolase [Rhodospirillaceae bacterium]
MIKPLVVGLALLCLTASNISRADEYRRFETRPGVTVSAIVVAPKVPRAVAILFSGGRGVIGVRPEGTIRYASNFLVASRDRFARNGIVAVVVDAPSDRINEGLEGGFRESAAHADDIRHVIQALRRDYKLPLWLVGTSRGSTSVANAGIRLQDAPPDGLVLTSSISRENRRGGNLLDMKLSEIRVPTLVAHHLEDECWVTPYDGAVEIEDALTGAGRAELMAFDGGEQSGNPCKPFSHHGFLGQRDAVIRTIADWIHANATF